MPSHVTFTEEETDLLARTADALSAYMGKPVLAELIDDPDIGAECVIFGLPLQPGEPDDDIVRVVLGGPQARFVGNRGGLSPEDTDNLECEFLWAIQLAALEGVRFIKLDREGEEVAWTSELREILPFDLAEISVPDDDAAEDDPADTTPPQAAT